MSVFDGNYGVIVARRKGDNTDPFVPITQNVKIVQGVGILQEIPSRANSFTVSNAGTSLSINDATLGQLPTPTIISVDYNQGLIYADPSLEAATLVCNFSGTGVMALSASRVFTKQQNGNITQTLDSIVSAASAFTHTGSYDNTVTYQVYNLASYQGGTFMCTSTSTGNLPTNTTYFKKITGFQWRNTYSTSATYNSGDAVADSSNQNVYISIVDNNTNNALSNTAYWNKLIDVTTVINTLNTTNTNITNAESSRVTAESNRVTAESNRASAESSRASAETSRTSAETTRGNNESTRQSQETTRQTQETTRQTAINNLNHLGPWSGSTAYQPRNVVSLNGSSYMCILAHTNQTPPNVTYWQSVGLKGNDGTGTVTSLASANGSIVIAGTAQVPDLSVNSGVGANQFPKRDASGNLQNIGYATTNVSANIILTLSQSGIINVTTGATDKTITLPDATTAQVVFTIKKVDSGAGHVVINTLASQIIDGSATKTLINQFSVITLVSSGGQWWVDVDNDTDKIGILSGLTTTAKSDLVSAINENKTNITTNTTDIGIKSNLTTNTKTDLVTAINEANNNKITSKSTNATLLLSERGVVEVITGTGIVTITLPSAATAQVIYLIKKVDAGTGTVVIATTSSQTIDGLTSRTLYNPYDYLAILSNGTSWDVVGRINKGEPWVAPTITGSWGNFGSGLAVAGYRKNELGEVYTKGYISGGTVTTGTVLWNYGVGYRPAETHRFTTHGYNGTTQVLVILNLDSTGNLSILNANSATQIDLDIIPFRAEV